MRRAVSALALLTAATLLPSTAFAQDGAEKTPETVQKPSPDDRATKSTTRETANSAETEATEPVAAAPKAKGPAVDPTHRDFDAYKIRVGDMVDVVVYKFKDLSRPYTVPANGHISFPPVGKVSLLGKTVFEVEETIRQGLKDGGYRSVPRPLDARRTPGASSRPSTNATR